MHLKELSENMKTAIDSDRTDIVCSILSSVEKCDSSNSANIIKSFLTENLTEDGTFLHYATKLDKTDICRVLLSAGANASISNNQGLNAVDLVNSRLMADVFREALLQATAHSKKDRICQLVDAGVEVNDVNSDVGASLRWAVTYADLETCHCLLKKGANVNSLSGEGATPLHDAVNRGDIDIIQCLCQFGANPNIIAIDGKFKGKSAMNIAESQSNKIFNVLQSNCEQSHMAKNMNFDHASEKDSLDSLASDDHNQVTSPITGHLSIHSSSTTPVDSSEFQQENELGIWERNEINDTSHPNMERLKLLWPQAKILQLFDGPGLILPKKPKVHVIQCTDGITVHQVNEIWTIYKERLKNLGHDFVLAETSQISSDIPAEAEVVCHINSYTLPTGRESFKFCVTSYQIRIVANDVQGLFYAVSYIVQLLRLFKSDEAIPQMKISDWPSVRYRGVVIDLSPNSRQLSMQYFMDFIDHLAELRFNQLHFYTTLSNTSNWQGSLTAEELLKIDLYCRQRFITMVPALEVDHTCGLQELTVLRSFLQNYLPCFNTEFIHLGPRLSTILLDPFDESLYDLWRYIPVSPSVIIFVHMETSVTLTQMSLLPSSVILLDKCSDDSEIESSITKGCHLTSDHIGGYGIIVSTEISKSISGQPDKMMNAIIGGAIKAFRKNAVAYVVCERSGSSYLTHKLFSWPGLMIASGLSWKATNNTKGLKRILADILNAQVFEDLGGGIGQMVLELGYIETALGNSSDQTVLHCLLSDPNSLDLDNLTPDLFQKSIKSIKCCQRNLGCIRMTCRDAAHLLRELQLTTEMQIFACRLGKALLTVGQNPRNDTGLKVINVGVSNLLPTMRTDLANKLLELIERYTQVWCARNLPTGLKNALHVLTCVLNSLIPEVKDSVIHT